MTASNTSPDREEAGVSHNEDDDSPSSSSDSSSSSTDKTSPSTTPPTPEAQPVANPTLGPRTHHDASYSATPPRRNKKHVASRNTTRLGAIDEHSNRIAPDIPSRNPARKHHRYGSASKFFSFAAYTRSDPSLPPVGAYDNITGPRGEKFGDLRQNKPFRPPNRGGWRRAICLGSVALVILLAIGLGVGLGLGLTRKKGTSNEIPTDSDSNTDNPAPFPIGTWSVPTYLTTTATDCTSNPSTWRCYPYTTYSANSSSSTTSSYSTLTWRITSPTNSSADLYISNTNPVFSYPFTNVTLQFVDTDDPRLSAYSFEFNYRKQVVPSNDITDSGAATRCYYNDTVLSVKLYNTAQGAGGDVREDNTTAAAGTIDWPFAIEYEERTGGGPQCFLYVNGTETEAVSVSAGSGDCVCGYRNYGLG